MDLKRVSSVALVVIPALVLAGLAGDWFVEHSGQLMQVALVGYAAMCVFIVFMLVITRNSSRLQHNLGIEAPRPLGTETSPSAKLERAKQSLWFLLFGMLMTATVPMWNSLNVVSASELTAFFLVTLLLIPIAVMIHYIRKLSFEGDYGP